MEAVQNPAEAGVDVAAIAAENAQLRQQLLAENEKLRAALAESQAAGLQAQGLTDEDVRRLEHPEEFVLAENEEFRAKLEDLQAQLNSVHAASVQAHHDAVPASPAESAASLSDEELQAEFDRRRQQAAGQ